MAGTSEAQDLFLKLIGASGRWNAFDGPKIEAALRANRQLWRSVVFTRPASAAAREWGLAGAVSLIVLRDLPANHVNLDTLFLLAEPGSQDGLEALAAQWSADEVGWIGQKEAFQAMGDSAVSNKDFSTDTKRVVLRVWWD